MELNIVLHNLKSPQNVGMIVRSAVAFRCNRIFFIGDEPWRFKKGSQAFSRKLEKIANIEYYRDEDPIFSICVKEDLIPIALEISENKSIFINNFIFPKKVALFFGNESYGLLPGTLEKCHHILTIPQFGPVGSINVAVASSIAMYEFMKNNTEIQGILGDQFIEV